MLTYVDIRSLNYMILQSLLLKPILTVDHVHLPSNTRVEYRLEDGKWVEEALNP